MDRVASAQPANHVTLNNAVNERNRRIKEIFTNAMPNFIKRTLLDRNEAATVQDLCTGARRQMVFFARCPSDEWSRDTFNEVNSSLSQDLVRALTKLRQQQDEPKQQQTDLSNRNSSLNNPIIKHLIRTTSEATKHSTEVAIGSRTRENSEDMETSTQDAADSIITEDITAYTTTGSTTHIYNNLRKTDLSHRQITQNKIATLADTEINMRGTAIRENQQTEINISLTTQHQKTNRATPVS